MRFTYCPDCGARLVPRSIGDEGEVPYCAACKRPLFDMFSSCVITLVTDEEGRVALLRQSDISKQYLTLVSGYIKPGETAEEAARREVMEELGLPLCELHFVKTVWFAKKELLMLAFIGKTKSTVFHLSREVEEAAWYTPSEAIRLVHPASPSSASHMLVQTYLDRL